MVWVASTPIQKVGRAPCEMNSPKAALAEKKVEWIHIRSSLGDIRLTIRLRTRLRL
jgi:hypothetical protein